MIKLPNSYMSKYKMRMFSYRIKSFLKGFFGGEGKRGSRIFSIFAVFILILLIASISVYGLNLKSKAEGQTQISAVTVVNYDGVSIHTKAKNISRAEAVNSAMAKSLDTIRFTLTVSNAGPATNTDVKFTLPAGFSYTNSVSGGAPSTTPCSGIINPVAGDLYWCGYSAPAAAESVIEFDTKAP